MDWPSLVTMMADIAVLVIVGAVAYLFRSTSMHGQRLAKLEAVNEAIDMLAETKAIHKRIDDIADGAAEQRGELKQINRLLGLIHQALIKDVSG